MASKTKFGILDEKVVRMSLKEVLDVSKCPQSYNTSQRTIDKMYESENAPAQHSTRPGFDTLTADIDLGPSFGRLPWDACTVQAQSIVLVKTR